MAPAATQRAAPVQQRAPVAAAPAPTAVAPPAAAPSAGGGKQILRFLVLDTEIQRFYLYF